MMPARSRFMARSEAHLETSMIIPEFTSGLRRRRNETPTFQRSKEVPVSSAQIRPIWGASHGMLRSILSYNVTRAVIGGVLFCYFVVCSIVGVSFSLAGEVIPIKTILRNPESYYLHVVTLEGTVRHVKTPAIPFGSCGQGGGGA